MLLSEKIYKHGDEGSTIFTADNGSVYLKLLIGFESNIRNCGGSIRADGLLSLNTSFGNVIWSDFKLIDSEFSDDTARMQFQLYDGRMQYECTWTLCGHTGVWSRKDRLTNLSPEDISIFRCLSKFTFSPGYYEVYSQNGNRKVESQGSWQKMGRAGIVLESEGGFSCQGATPYLCLREIGKQCGLAFHIVPQGSWRFSVRNYTSSSKASIAVLEAGLSDENLNLNLKAASFIDLPELLIHSLPNGEPQSGMPILHRYLNGLSSAAKPTLPVVYNTWYDYWDSLTVDRLRSQLTAAKEAGCEVFVIDAGWYGAGGGNWSMQVGDWREKLDASFHGHMAEFADEVRDRGLGFGLWVEPERIGTAAPILTEHPEWFLPSTGNFYYPNLADEKVYQYILSELCRLIDTYRLAWMKVDFNYELGLDPDSAEYYFYYAGWNRLFTEVRRRHTDVCYEGCAGGGMRLDINSLRKHDCYWMSDNGNPLDILSIYQNTILRASPGRITKWAVLRPATASYPKVSSPTETLPPSVVTWTSTGRPWEGYITTDLDFAVLSAMPGVLGLSGDIAGLSAKDQAKLSQHVTFFKKWRHLIANSVAYLNAAPLQLWIYEGWTSIQLQDPKDTTSLLFVYRLEDPCMERPFLLKDLFPNRMYRVVDEDATGQPQVFTGRQLMQDGVIVRIDRKYNARVLVIEAWEDVAEPHTPWSAPYRAAQHELG